MRLKQIQRSVRSEISDAVADGRKFRQPLCAGVAETGDAPPENRRPQIVFVRFLPEFSHHGVGTSHNLIFLS